MTSLHHIFERTVLGNATGGGAYYDPRAFTLCVPDHGADNLAGATWAHELIHWLQHIALNFGGFLSASSAIRDEHASHVLHRFRSISKDLDSDQSKEISRRIPMTGAFFDPFFGHERVEETIWAYQCGWRDLLVCERLFLRLSSFPLSLCKDANLRPQELVPRALVRIHNWSCPFLRYRIQPKELPFDINEPLLLKNFSPASHRGISLDTIDIIEGMPIAAELEALADQLPLHLNQRFREVEGTYYVKAIQIFLDIFGLPFTALGIARAAPIFLSLAELALQAPLPPFGIMGAIELEWTKIYPPQRFIDLCITAKDTPGYSIESPWPVWLEEWSVAVKAQYLVKGGALNYLDNAKDGYLPSAVSMPFLNLVAQEDHTFRELLNYKGSYDPKQICEFDSALNRAYFGLEIYAMLRHGHMLTQNAMGISYVWQMLAGLNEESYYWRRPPLFVAKKGKHQFPKWGRRYQPPLYIGKSGKINYGGWSKRFAAYLYGRNIQTYPLDDLFLDRTPTHYLQDFPEAVSKEARDHMLEPLRTALGDII